MPVVFFSNTQVLGIEKLMNSVHGNQRSSAINTRFNRSLFRAICRKMSDQHFTLLIKYIEDKGQSATECLHCKVSANDKRLIVGKSRCSPIFKAVELWRSNIDLTNSNVRSLSHRPFDENIPAGYVCINPYHYCKAPAQRFESYEELIKLEVSVQSDVGSSLEADNDSALADELSNDSIKAENLDSQNDKFSDLIEEVFEAIDGSIPSGYDCLSPPRNYSETPNENYEEFDEYEVLLQPDDSCGDLEADSDIKMAANLSPKNIKFPELNAHDRIYANAFIEEGFNTIVIRQLRQKMQNFLQANPTDSAITRLTTCAVVVDQLPMCVREGERFALMVMISGIYEEWSLFHSYHTYQQTDDEEYFTTLFAIIFEEVAALGFEAKLFISDQAFENIKFPCGLLRVYDYSHLVHNIRVSWLARHSIDFGHEPSTIRTSILSWAVNFYDNFSIEQKERQPLRLSERHLSREDTAQSVFIYDVFNLAFDIFDIKTAKILEEFKNTSAFKHCSRSSIEPTIAFVKHIAEAKEFFQSPNIDLGAIADTITCLEECIAFLEKCTFRNKIFHCLNLLILSLKSFVLLLIDIEEPFPIHIGNLNTAKLEQLTSKFCIGNRTEYEIMRLMSGKLIELNLIN